MSNQIDETHNGATSSSASEGRRRVLWRLILLPAVLVLFIWTVDAFDDWKTRQELEKLEKRLHALEQEVERVDLLKRNRDVN